MISVMLATTPLTPMFAYAADTVDKSETVHVETDAAGSVTTITVDELLANGSAAQELQDYSTLSDITPDEDDQSYIEGKDDGLTWTTGGKDVSYEGTISADVPVRIKVTYTLDGKPTEPSKLAGASGHLVIRIDYENTVSELRTVNGKQTRIYTPFVCMTAATLDSDIFHNVSVKNGKVLDDKGGIAVIGYALPGLQESLDLDATDLDLDLDFPKYVQIEADVSNLALDPIYTIVTPELLSDLDTSDLDFGDMGEGSDELRDAMDLLINGSGSLGEGLRKIADGSKQLSGGAQALKEALGALPNGLSALKEGSATLSGKLSEASSVASGLADGATELSNGATGAVQLIGGAQDSVAAASDSVSSLKEKVQALNLNDAKTAVNEASSAAQKAHDDADEAKTLLEGTATQVDTQKDTVAQDLSTVQGSVDSLANIASDESLGLTPEQQEALAGKLSEAQGQLTEQLGTATTDLDAIDAAPSAEASEKITALGTAASDLAARAERIKSTESDITVVTDSSDQALTALGKASGSLGSAAGYLQSVAQGAKGLSAGVQGISSGLGVAASGAQQLTDALNALTTSAPQAVSGADALATGATQLTDAITAAADGSGQLTDGLSTFNDEGISKIIDTFNDLDNDLSSTTDRLDALRDAARDYDIFAGKTEGASSSVRFIYKTEQIG